MRIRSSLAASAGISLVVLAGCGSDSGDLVADRDQNTPVASRTSSEAVPTDGESNSGQSNSGRTLTKENFVDAVAAAQLEAQTAHIAADITAAGTLIVMDGDVRFGSTLADYATDLSMSGGGVGNSMHMVFVDKVMYLNLGVTTAHKFVKLDLGDKNSALGQMMSQFLSSADPSNSLEAMSRGVTGFRAIGNAEIDGVSTTQYRVQVDTRALRAAEGMSDLPGGAARQLPPRLSYDMWVGDDDDLLRRTALSMGSTMEMTMDMTEWGEPVDITAPPRSQVSQAALFAGMPQG